MTRIAASRSATIAAFSLFAMTPAVLFAQTTVRFAAHRDYPAGYGPASISVGDINGDQRQDLVSANYLDHSVAVLLGNVDGTFQRPRSVFFDAEVGPRSVAIADF